MIRLSAIPYINALPLVYHLSGVCSRVEVIQACPSEALGLLDHSKVDMALVPVKDCLNRPDLQRISGLGICSHGPVTSVLLQCEGPIQSVRAIRPDPSSRTSNSLVRVLCRFHWGVSPEFVGPYDPADACVVIGDPALTLRPSPNTLDLSEHWRRMTGLPFVFAVWVCRRGRPDVAALTAMAHAAYDRAEQTMPELAAEGARRLGLSSRVCQHYLTCCLHYRVGPPEERALKQFEQYMNELSQGGRHRLSPQGAIVTGDTPYVEAC